MSAEDDLDARLAAAGERWRAANKTIANVDLGYLELAAEPVDVPVAPAGSSAPRRRRLRVVVEAGAGMAAAVAATVIAVGLSVSPAKTHRAGGIGANGLVGVDWRLVKVVGLAPTPTAVDKQARLMIDSRGQLTGTDGCNSLGSHVTITSSTINLGSVVSTDMACLDRTPGFTAAVTRVDAVLAGTLQWSVQGNELTLSRNGTPALVYRAAPAPSTDPKALTAGQWLLDSVLRDAPNGSVSSLPPGATLKFDGRGRFTASDGCNSGGGQVAVKAGALVISNYVSTQMACPGSQSNLVRQFLDGRLTWSVKDGELSLTKAGLGSLSYHNQPALGGASAPSTGSS